MKFVKGHNFGRSDVVAVPAIEQNQPKFGMMEVNTVDVDLELQAVAISFLERCIRNELFLGCVHRYLIFLNFFNSDTAFCRLNKG